MEELKSGVEESDYCKVQNVLLKCLEHLKEFEHLETWGGEVVKEAWTVDELMKVFTKTMKKKPLDEVVHAQILRRGSIKGNHGNATK